MCMKPNKELGRLFKDSLSPEVRVGMDCTWLQFKWGRELSERRKLEGKRGNELEVGPVQDTRMLLLNIAWKSFPRGWAMIAREPSRARGRFLSVVRLEVLMLF